jgi:hypothetical protein
MPIPTIFNKVLFIAKTRQTKEQGDINKNSQEYNRWRHG